MVALCQLEFICSSKAKFDLLERLNHAIVSPQKDGLVGELPSGYRAQNLTRKVFGCDFRKKGIMIIIITEKVFQSMTDCNKEKLVVC